MDGKRRAVAERALSDGNGILRLEPAWIERDFLCAGFRMGLDEEQGTVWTREPGVRWEIAERWFASETLASNRIPKENEGLSFLALEDERMTMIEAMDLLPEEILGAEHVAQYGPRMHRLVKLFDYGDRLPYHLHQQQHDAAKVGRNAKEEAYFFPAGVDFGKHPETFLGCHPYIVREGKQEATFLPYLEKWDSDLILQHAPAVKQIPNDGFHVPSGMLHAPGTALTFELQESSDVYSMWQALCGGKLLSKDVLYKDVHPDERRALGERAVLPQVNWEASGDPLFYENRHTPPLLIEETPTGRDEWVFYNSDKFSGKRLTLKPGQRWMLSERGAYALFVWRGRGTVDGHEVQGQNLGMDELLVTYRKAVEPIPVVNAGTDELELFRIFGKGIYPDCPRLSPRTLG